MGGEKHFSTSVVKSLVGRGECCALPRTASVFSHERNYIRSYVSTGNEMQHNPFCLPSLFLAHKVKKSCSPLQSSLSGCCSWCRDSASLPGETPTRQLEHFPGKKGAHQFLTFWINVVAKRLLDEERSVAPCSAALAVVQHKVPARCQPELRAPRRWRRRKIHARGSGERRKGERI